MEVCFLYVVLLYMQSIKILKDHLDWILITLEEEEKLGLFIFHYQEEGIVNYFFKGIAIFIKILYWVNF